MKKAMNEYAEELVQKLKDVYSADAVIEDTGEDAKLIIGNLPIRAVVSIANVYESGESVNEAALKLYDAYRTEVKQAEEVQNMVSSFNNCRCNLYAFCVDSTKTDMKDYVTFPVTKDICAGFYIKVSSGSVKVTKGMMDMWGVSIQDIYDAAGLNMDRNKVCVDLLEELKRIKEASDDPVIAKMDFEEFKEVYAATPQYILSTQYKLYGSGYMAYPELIQKAMRENGLDDVYIVPSSIHELILMPKNAIKKDDLDNMIKEVNASCLKAEERLADHAYEMYIGAPEILVA